MDACKVIMDELSFREAFYHNFERRKLVTPIYNFSSVETSPITCLIRVSVSNVNNNIFYIIKHTW